MWYRMGITWIQLRQWSWWNGDTGETFIKGRKCKLCCCKCIQAAMSKCFSLFVHLLSVLERPPPQLPNPRKPSWCYYGRATPTPAGWRALVKLLWLQQRRDATVRHNNPIRDHPQTDPQSSFRSRRWLTSTSRPTDSENRFIAECGCKGAKQGFICSRATTVFGALDLPRIETICSADPSLRPLQSKRGSTIVGVSVAFVETGAICSSASPSTVDGYDFVIKILSKGEEGHLYSISS